MLNRCSSIRYIVTNTDKVSSSTCTENDCMMSDTLFHTIVIALAVIFITDNVVTIAGFCHFDKKIKKFADELKLQKEKLS